MLVTTVVPTYRRPESLARAVRSALDQTVSDHVVVVVDDLHVLDRPSVEAILFAARRLAADRAARWLVNRLTALGVEPAGDSFYFHRVALARQVTEPLETGERLDAAVALDADLDDPSAVVNRIRRPHGACWGLRFPGLGQRCRGFGSARSFERGSV